MPAGRKSSDITNNAAAVTDTRLTTQLLHDRCRSADRGHLFRTFVRSAAVVALPNGFGTASRQVTSFQPGDLIPGCHEHDGGERPDRTPRRRRLRGHESSGRLTPFPAALQPSAYDSLCTFQVTTPGIPRNPAACGSFGMYCCIRAWWSELRWRGAHGTLCIEAVRSTY